MQVEMKAKVEDFSRIRKYLASHGAVQTEVIRQIDYYLDPPGKNLHGIGDNQMFRLRYDETQKRCWLARAFAKSMSKESKTREKREVEIIGPLEDVLWIFTSVGFRIAYEVVKKRENYNLGDVRISLDRVEGLGDFVEIEKSCEDGDREKVEKFLDDIFIQMSIEGKDKDSRPYMWMLIEKSQK